MCRKTRPDPTGDELHERRVRENQAVAKIRILGLPVLLPERLGIERRHGKRIRRAEAESSGAPTNKRAPREIAHPQSERCSREGDHPGTTPFERGRDGDEPQTERQQREEETEKPPLHAPSVVPMRRRPEVAPRAPGTWREIAKGPGYTPRRNLGA